MRIAAITITYNDFHSIDQWKDLYSQYSGIINHHIIVDNNSQPAYKKKLASAFPSSIIIYRELNGGTTAAYNDGLKHALQTCDLDAILIIANDIAITAKDIVVMSEFLVSSQGNAIVCPLLLNSNSQRIETFGYFFDKKFRGIKPNIKQKPGELPGLLQSDTVSGGLNMAKVEFYRAYGFQDENLFMYGDELDMALRLKAKGLQAYYIRDAIALHKHINIDNQKFREGYTEYLMARNKIYLAHKHFGLKMALIVFLDQCKLIPSKMLTYYKAGKLSYIWYWIRGIFSGLFLLKNRYVPNSK